MCGHTVGRVSYVWDKGRSVVTDEIFMSFRP